MRLGSYGEERRAHERLLKASDATRGGVELVEADCEVREGEHLAQPAGLVRARGGALKWAGRTRGHAEGEAPCRQRKEERMRRRTAC